MKKPNYAKNCNAYPSCQFHKCDCHELECMRGSTERIIKERNAVPLENRTFTHIEWLKFLKQRKII